MSKRNKAAERAARAAALKAERERQERLRRNLTIGAVVLGIVVIIGGGFLIQSQRDSTGQVASTVPAGVQGYGIPVGDPEAESTVTIYEDLQCPACAALEAQLGPDLDAAIAAGRVNVDYRLVSFLDDASTDDYSSRALNTALVVLDTAGVEAFKELHGLLFADQPAEGGPGHTDDQLIAYAVQAGASEQEVRGPIEDKVYDQWIRNATDQMSRDGVNGTPTLRVGDEDIDVAELAELLE